MTTALGMAAALLMLMTAPDSPHLDLDPQTRAAVTTAWNVFVRIAPHLKI
ncbi:hypothetical protein [Methylobacterium sp. R2-1]|nr:hypothetical protein [Methylobacterium sp. R2-1]MBB2962538.1 hypothetical protein [Methylobacterium sp. R2-1]